MKKDDSKQASVPFVGRQAELVQLRLALESVESTRKPLFVLVEGDYGVGKTALLQHFLAHAQTRNPELLIGQCRCAAEHERESLIPMHQLLEDLTGRRARRHVASREVFEFVKDVTPGWLDFITLGLASPTVATVEGLARLFSRGRFKQENAFAQYTNALAALAGDDRTVIAFIDDMQWADQSSLELVFHLSRNLPDGAILFLCAYRPVEALETGLNKTVFGRVQAELVRYGARQLEVKTGIEVKEYAGRRYPRNTFPEAFLANVQEQTGGHAFYVHELFSLWEESGVIARLEGGKESGWNLVRPVERLPEIPKLSAVLEERIHRMEGGLRQVLTFASVEGEDFTLQAVARLRQLDPLQVSDDLNLLEDHYRLVQEVRRPESGRALLNFYRFAHRFFRDYIYSKLSDAQRQILHQRVGECLETLYADPGPVAGQLALHFEKCGDYSKAARYALAAARLEQARYGNAEAERWCHLGLEWLEKHLPVTATGQVIYDAPGKALRLDLLDQLANVSYRVGDHPVADARYRDVIRLAEDLDIDPERLAGLYARLADICDERDETEEGLRCVEQAKRVLTSHSVPLSETHIEVMAIEALLLSRLEENDQAIALALQALADAQQLPQTPSLLYIESDTYCNLGIAYGYLDRFDEAIGAYEKSMHIARGIGDQVMVGYCLSNMSDDYMLHGRFDDARQTIARSLEVARHIGDDSLRCQSLLYRARLAMEDGYPARAVDDLLEAAALAERIDSRWTRYEAHTGLGRAYLALEDLPRASEHAAAGLALAGDTERWRADALFAQAEVEAARQQWDLALEHFDESLLLAEGHVTPRGFASMQRDYAALLVQRGALDRACDLLQRALHTFEAVDAPEEVAKTKRLLDAIQQEESAQDDR